MSKSPKKSKSLTRAGNRPATISAQQTIPYVRMLPDGICQLPGGVYTKTLEYEDINYSVASAEDQAAIFGGWSSWLNYFDSSLPFQLSFVNRRSRSGSRYKVNISEADDRFNSVRTEYTGMLKNQIAKSNNGIERAKYVTFCIPAENVAAARPRLERVEADVIGNFKRLGVQSQPLDGRERLALLHGQLHPGSREPFRFKWADIAHTGMGTKDFIVPDSFDFRQSRSFRVGQTWGAVSYLQIMASELSDKLLLEILELDAELTVTMHIQTVDQVKAIKTVKGKISDIDKMKVEEQRKATRAGYDPDILPPDLVTFSKDAAELLADLQSRNERMFLLTFLIVNTAPTRVRLENDIFTVNGIAQKYNCAVKRLDWQQEQGYMSSLALGYNGIEIQRGMTTSSTAIFIPFMTRELRMDGQALYYGMNALSNNVIMADRKKLKSANGMYLGSTGSGKSFAAKRELLNVFLAIPQDRIIVVDPMGEYAPLVERLGVPVQLTEGSRRNIKLTTPEDLLMAEAFFAEQALPALRVGQGYDVHRLVEGRPLILCGVTIPHSLGLLGHSDADVALHALMDAMLGAMALGDIGKHFPDTDEAYRGISSMLLLRHVVALLKAHHARVTNCDVTIVAQKPKLLPYIPQMRQNVADALELPLARVNIKATTTEKLGFEGEEKGISAQAVCMVQGNG